MRHQKILLFIYFEKTLPGISTSTPPITPTQPLTYTHTVPAGVVTHTVAGHPVVGGVLPAFAAHTVAIAAPAAAEAVIDA